MPRIRAGLVCATAALLPAGYVLAAGIPLLLVWVAERAAARRWPWERSPVDLALFAWVSVVVLVSLLSPHRDLALPNALLLALAPVAALAPALRTLRERPGMLRAVCGAWTAGGAVAGAWVIWRYLQAPGVGKGDLPQLGSNAAGTVLASASLLGLGLAVTSTFRGGHLTWLAQGPILAGLLATLSRGAWGAWLGGLVCFALLLGRGGRRRLLAFLLLVPALAAAAFAYPATRARLLSAVDPRQNLDRILLWRAGWRMAVEHPWTGVGFGAFVREYPKYRLPGDPNTAPPFAHNLPLSLAAETGVPGLLAFLVFSVAVLRAGGRVALRAPPENRGLAAAAYSALVTVLLQQLVDGTLQSFHLGFAFWLLVAAVLASDRPTRASEVGP